MAFNVKDEEVIHLADDLMHRLHLPSRIDAIRYALKAQIEVTQSRIGNRTDELLDVMTKEIWPLLNDGKPVTKQEREQILGYDPTTGV
jgi:antitoxin VapB